MNRYPPAERFKPEAFVKQNRAITLLLLVFLIGYLTACQSGGQEVSPAVETPSISPTETAAPPEPTATPTALPERAILVMDAASVAASNAQLQTVLEQLAGEAGWQLSVVPTLEAQELDSGVRLVVMLAPGDNLAELAAAAPNTQFVAVGIPGIEPQSNVSVIASGREQAGELGFAAGYIAAVVTEDWRVGVLGPPGSLDNQAFLNGAVYFCGLCNPPFPPFDYPLQAEAPAGAGAAEWQAAADSLIAPERDVRTIFVAPGAGDNALLGYLVQAGVFVIGVNPPPPAAQPRWVATVYADPVPALKRIWPEVLAGNGSQTAEMSVGYTDVNTAVFTPGRQNLVNGMLRDLDAGLIDTGVTNPAGSS
jgi:hypothetical protein